MVQSWGISVYGLVVALSVPGYAFAREEKKIKTAHAYYYEFNEHVNVVLCKGNRTDRAKSIGTVEHYAKNAITNACCHVLGLQKLYEANGIDKQVS